MKFLKEVTPNGKTIHHILPRKYQLHSEEEVLNGDPYSIYKQPTTTEIALEIIQTKQVVLAHPFSFFELATKVVDIGSLGVGDAFGLDDEFILPDCETNAFESACSVVADCNIELIKVSKEDFESFKTANAEKVNIIMFILTVRLLK